MRLDALERLQSKDGKKEEDGPKATPVPHRDANPNPNPLTLTLTLTPTLTLHFTSHC